MLPIHFQICTRDDSIVAFTITDLYRFGSFPPFVLHYHGSSLPPGWPYVRVVGCRVIGIDGQLFQICGSYIIVNRECGTRVLQDRTSHIGVLGGSIQWRRFELFLDDGFNTCMLGFEFTHDTFFNDLFASFCKAMKCFEGDGLLLVLCFQLWVRHHFPVVVIFIGRVCKGGRGVVGWLDRTALRQGVTGRWIGGSVLVLEAIFSTSIPMKPP